MMLSVKIVNLKLPRHVNVAFRAENIGLLTGWFCFFLDDIGKFFYLYLCFNT